MDKISFVNTVMTKWWNIVGIMDEKRIASQTPDNGLITDSDISYIADGRREHFLDVYYPENTGDKKLPVIIDIHGGGWMYGYKEINKNYCLRLAKRGYVVFSVNYRLVPEVDFGGQVQDVMAAFNFIEKKLADYPCDTDNIYLTGDSAGGHIAAYLNIVNQSEELQKIYGAVSSGLRFNAICLTSPVAFPDDGVFSFGLCPLFGYNREYKEYGNLFNIDSVIKKAETPPTLIITSTGDFLARTQSYMLKALYDGNGIECKLHEFGKFEGKALPHVFAVVNPYNTPAGIAIGETLMFFEDHKK